MLAGIEEGVGDPGHLGLWYLVYVTMNSLSDERRIRRGCRRSPITRLDALPGGRFADQKKGSSFGTTAAASRGVFYELPFRRGKSRNGFTCTSSSTRGQSGFADLPDFDAGASRSRALPDSARHGWLIRPASPCVARCGVADPMRDLGVPFGHFGARPSRLATACALPLSLFLSLSLFLLL